MERQINNTKKEETNKYYRFQVYQANQDENMKLRKTKSVGMAYLKEGQNIISLRLWMFSNERYYILPHKDDSSKYLVMTREPNKNLKARTKYFWNIVGNGVVDSSQGVICLDFDLLGKSIYINIQPEPSAYTHDLPSPDELLSAA